MTLKEKHSKLINSVAFWQYVNNDMENVRKDIRNYAELHNYKGELLNAYNKTFIFVDYAMKEYLCNDLPKKYLIGIFRCI